MRHFLLALLPVTCYGAIDPYGIMLADHQFRKSCNGILRPVKE